VAAASKIMHVHLSWALCF